MSTSQAILHTQYGAPDVLSLGTVDRPALRRDDDVLVRVHAANASIADHHIITGKPYLIRLTPYGGVRRPRNRVPGMGLAGVVEAVGAGVTTLRPGDAVYGEAKSGAFAEYAVVPAALLAPKPATLSFEEAAAAPWGVAALQGLRDAGGVTAGHSVLIIGASGGVGTWAVQIAKARGARVTAVCSTRAIDLVRGLGADHVIDYTREDFAVGEARYDVVLDLVGDRSIGDGKRVLTPRGTYVACAARGGDWFGPLFRLAALKLAYAFSRRKVRTFIASPNRDDLVALAQLIDAGRARPVIERRYPLAEVPAALAHVGAGHARGQTVITIA